MNTKGTTLKETTQRRMSEIARRTVPLYREPYFYCETDDRITCWRRPFKEHHIQQEYVCG